MLQNVKQWIDEIRILQQKLNEAHQERDEAFASATKWRSLYETEAKQRRTEVRMAQRSTHALKTEIQDLTEPDYDHPLIHLQQQMQVGSVAELQAKLAWALLENERLNHDIQAEQASHAETRKALITALGDTVERLTQERAARHQEDFAAVQRQTVVITHETVQPQLTTPLPALPPTDLAQSRS